MSSLNGSYNLARCYVEVVLGQLREWVGKDAPRSSAAKVLDEWRLKAGLSPELRAAVLDYFTADRDPVPGLDFPLPAELEPACLPPGGWGEWGELPT